MPEEVSNDFHRRSTVEKVLGGGMAQRMWTSPTGYYAYFRQTVGDQLAEVFSPERFDRRTCSQEETAAMPGWPGIPNVAQNGVPNGLRQRPYMNPARLCTTDPDRRIFPVDVIKGQPGDFAGSQTVIRQEHQNGKVSLA